MWQSRTLERKVQIMGILSRTKLLFQVKSHSALDQLEQPIDVLDYAEQQQRVLLRSVGQGLIEVATARHRLSRQAEHLRKQAPRLEDQARRAMAADREDLARMALQKRQSALAQLTDLEEELAEVTREEQTLMTAHQQVSGRVEEFQVQRIVASARYQSATARLKVGEMLSGVSGELADLGIAVGRAQESTQRLQTRASAIDALVASGVLSPLFGANDAVERELRGIASQKSVDEEIERMREQQGKQDQPMEGSG
jgi:phage shock protein A